MTDYNIIAKREDEIDKTNVAWAGAISLLFVMTNAGSVRIIRCLKLKNTNNLITIIVLITFYARGIMKLKLVAGLFLMAAVGNAYSETLMSNGQPISVNLSNKGTVSISNCAEYVALRKEGGTVNDYPGLSDPDFREAQDALKNCYLDAYANENDLKEVTPSLTTLSVANVVEHFPAQAALAISDEEVAKLKKNFIGKTIIDTAPDLKSDGVRMISTKTDSGYMVWNRRAFEDSAGKMYSFITLSSFPLSGTYASLRTYQILSEEEKVWTIKEVTENSPL